MTARTATKPRTQTHAARGGKRAPLWLLVALWVTGCGFGNTQTDPNAQGGFAGNAGMSTAPGASGSTSQGGAGGSGMNAAGAAGAPVMPSGGMNAGGGSAGAAGMSPGAGAGGMSAAGTGGMGGMDNTPSPMFTGKLEAIAYSPYRDGQAPGGAQPTEAQVREDLLMLQPLTRGIRVYGTDGANAYIPDLCDELGIELHIGAWIDGLPSDEPNALALAEIVNENHPSIKTAIVGNEVLHRAEDNGVTEERLIELIELVKAEVTVDVPIAAADTYPRWMEMRPALAESVDVLIWHTYAWWAGADIGNAYALVASRYQDMMTAYPGKTMILGETGWPSQIDRMSTDMTTTSVGNEENQTRYYLEILGGMQAAQLPVWMFSSIDEQWKAASGEGAVGEFWGIFNSDRTPKMAATELLLRAGN